MSTKWLAVRVETFILEKPIASILILRGAFGNIVDYKYYLLSSVYIVNSEDIAVTGPS